MADVFISYAHEDRERVRGIVDLLERANRSVFWDRTIPVGETWRSHIGRAIEQARCVVVAWSTHSVSSDWVIQEADEARLRGILVPVMLDEVRPPMGFREIQAADFSASVPRAGGPAAELFLTAVARVLETGLHEPQPPPYRPAEPPRSFRLPAMAVAGLLVVAVAGGGLLYLTTGRGQPSPPSATVPADSRPRLVTAEPTPLLNSPPASQAAQPETPGDYPQFSQRVIAAADVAAMTCDDLLFARNEIFARHGYRFRLNPRVIAHFEAQSWYQPSADDVSAALTVVEQTNIATLKGAEREKACSAG